MAQTLQITPESMDPEALRMAGGGPVWQSARLAFGLALMAHLAFAGLVAIDEWKHADGSATAEIETLVDLVSESEASGGAPATADDKPPAETEHAAPASPEPAAKLEQTPEQAAQHPQESEPPPPEAPPQPTQAASAPLRGPVEPPPPPAQGGRDNPAEPPPDQQPAARAGEGAKPPPRLPLFASPDFMGAARSASQGSSLNDDYKGAVYAMLEKAKQYPASAAARGASGVAVVTFEIDEGGNPRAIVVARSSGQPDLDAEALAMVRRAAPYPAPPRGAQRAFAPAIMFGAN